VNAKTSDPTPDERAPQTGAESSLGALLRRAREAQNLSLRDISDQTRISRRYLEAIEADDYKNLPGGIFNRSFVKAFAKAVGVNEAEAIRGYERTARAHGETPDELPTSRQPSRIYTEGETARSPLVTILLSVLILAIISLAVYAALHFYQRRNQTQVVGPQPTPAAPAANANAPQAAQPAPAQATQAAQGLNVQIKAKGEDVWLRTKRDAEPSSEAILGAEQIKELTATDTLSLQYSKSKAKALEVTINGRPANVPGEAAKGKILVEMLITKDNKDNYASPQPQP
jgi:cytoskeletal protein RodZ